MILINSWRDCMGNAQTFGSYHTNRPSQAQYTERLMIQSWTVLYGILQLTWWNVIFHTLYFCGNINQSDYTDKNYDKTLEDKTFILYAQSHLRYILQYTFMKMKSLYSSKEELFSSSTISKKHKKASVWRLTNFVTWLATLTAAVYTLVWRPTNFTTWLTTLTVSVHTLVSTLTNFATWLAKLTLLVYTLVRTWKHNTDNDSYTCKSEKSHLQIGRSWPPTSRGQFLLRLSRFTW
jgi:hypothetical protein